MITDARQTLINRYGVDQVSKLEEFVHISRPDKYSPVYQEFINAISVKVGQLAKLLNDHGVSFSSNEFIDGHLYRIYIIDRDILVDFEYYPVVNFRYNYLRINWNDDISQVFMRLYPNNILQTEEVDVWRLTQRATNRFLKDNNASPWYDSGALRLGFVRDNEIYQAMTVGYDNKSGKNRLISNVTKLDCQVNYGTVVLLRYFKEMFDIEGIEVISNLDNSFRETTYQLMGMKLIEQKCKKKIWWSPKHCSWHIDKQDVDRYVPFYFTEKRIWVY